MTDDLFDDTPTVPSEVDSKVFSSNEVDTPPKDAEEIKEPLKETESDPGTGETEVVPPATDHEEKAAEKFIPEHQFKAALKNVTDRLEKLQQENAQLKAVPPPDREKDPEGYERHVRIETSKAVMIATHPDYNEVIMHYAEMAKMNPSLNDAVAKADVPAKFAYDVAKRDLEIQEILAQKDSDEWKEFQAWRKGKRSENENLPTQQKVEELLSVPKKTSVPNLNRSTDVSRKTSSFSDNTEELFKGAL